MQQLAWSRLNRTHSPLARSFLAGAALLALLVLPLMTAAQSAPIVSTATGEVPSTGGRRSAPLLQAVPVIQRAGTLPVAITIEQAQVDAQIETLGIVDGVMENPTGPWVVSWYKETARLGELGNAVMAGHIDYWNVGPAVFYTIAQLGEGDEINVTGADGEVYTYQVEWVRDYDADNAPLEEIVGQTDDEALTLITCGGTFDYANGVYLQRTVVRAARVTA